MVSRFSVKSLNQLKELSFYTGFKYRKKSLSTLALLECRELRGNQLTCETDNYGNCFNGLETKRLVLKSTYTYIAILIICKPTAKTKWPVCDWLEYVHVLLFWLAPYCVLLLWILELEQIYKQVTIGSKQSNKSLFIVYKQSC